MGDHNNVGVTLVDASRVSATGFDRLVLENRPLAMRNNSDSIVHDPSHVMSAYLTLVKILNRARFIYQTHEHYHKVDVSDVYCLFLSVSLNTWIEFIRCYPFAELVDLLGEYGALQNSGSPLAYYVGGRAIRDRIFLRRFFVK